MKVVYHQAFNQVYTSDPAAKDGRIRAIKSALMGKVDFVTPEPATREDILRVHTPGHVDYVERKGLYDIAALAAGGAIEAAQIGLTEPCFAVIRPPGHHASANNCWGFCYFNNMAIALCRLKAHGQIENAFVLDFDLHEGDGNINILGGLGWVTILNPGRQTRSEYLQMVERALTATHADMIAASAGFDNAREDWGGLLHPEDYTIMGGLMREAAQRNRGGCFGILEGGYNHNVLGQNVLAFIEGLQG